jgi:hypothetical protein
MRDHRISLPAARRWISSCLVVASIAALTFAHGGKVLAKAPTHALQGLFCNAAEQIDDALSHMRGGLSPQAAVQLINDDEVVCTFVDALHYVVDRPVIIQEIRGAFPLFKYEATLVSVIVGGVVRLMTPPVHVFFAIPERLDDAPLEGRA